MAPVHDPRPGMPQPTISERGHPMPRRATPEKSVTLRHHRLARDASMRPEPGSKAGSGGPQRRTSSGESNYTGQSDPKNWFDRSNRNPPATFDHASMHGNDLLPGTDFDTFTWAAQLTISSRPTFLPEAIRFVQRRTPFQRKRRRALPFGTLFTPSVPTAACTQQ